jgi:putative endonuclease
MAIWVYILGSEATKRYYCGQTGNLSSRLGQHKDPMDQRTRTTKRFRGPWRLIWSKECPNRSEGMKIERMIKRGGIERYLNDHRLQRLASGGC